MELSYAQYVSTKTNDEGYSVFPKGCLVWLRDESMGYRPARVIETFERGTCGRVQIVPGTAETKVSEQDSQQLLRMNEQSLLPVDDMANMKELNHPSILHNLRIRFEADVIHTKVGSVLISVNPHQQVKSFSPEYKNNVASGKIDYESVPHIYCVAESCYQKCLRTQKSQSCVITGETGSGKTEAARSFLDYLAERCNGEGSEGSSIYNMIHDSSPLIQAFGNAKTARNPNSSRFGLWTEAFFNQNKQGVMTSARSIPILLEKSRVTALIEGEQNFHVFQQLCSAAASDTKLRDTYGLLPAKEFMLLDPHGELSINEEELAKEWNIVLAAMERIGISESERNGLIGLLAGILHLGNVEFGDESSETAEVQSAEPINAIEIACQCLGISRTSLESALCGKTRVINGEEFVNPYTPIQAKHVRDAVVKSLYCNAFHWLVSKINKAMAKDESDLNSSIVGVLDIFGFESFESNHFEQLCINYCNEKLQFFFNQVAFVMEQSECEIQGIDTAVVQFVSNEPCIKLFDGVSSPGLLGMINDQTTLALNKANETGLGMVMVPEITTSNTSHRSTSPTRTSTQQVSPRKKVQPSPLLRHLVRANAAHPNFRKLPAKSRKSQHSFSIVHFAGEVTYSVSDLLAKNSDVVDLSLLQVVTNSTVAFVATIGSERFEPEFGGSGTETKSSEQCETLEVGQVVASTEGKRSPRPTILGQLRVQFDKLMKRIESSTPHFVKCIEPNASQKRNLFDSKLVLQQMRYAGLLELCRIRQLGFPVRLSKEEFGNRYRGVLRLRMVSMGEDEPDCTDPDQVISKLAALDVLKGGKFEVGNSKVMLKYDVFDDLETARDLVVNLCSISIQSIVRGWLARRDVTQMTDAIQDLRRLASALAKKPGDSDTKLDLEEAIANAESCLPYGGNHITELQTARSALVSSAWAKDVDTDDEVEITAEILSHSEVEESQPKSSPEDPLIDNQSNKENNQVKDDSIDAYQDPEASLLSIMTAGKSSEAKPSTSQPQQSRPMEVVAEAPKIRPTQQVSIKQNVVDERTDDEKILDMLSNALDTRNTNDLKLALNAVENSKVACGADVNAKVTEAEALLDRIEREENMVQELQEAARESTERDLIRLQTAITTAQRMHMTPEDFPALQVAMQREAEVQELRKRNSTFKHALNERFGQVIQELSGQLFGGDSQDVERQAWENAQQAAAAVDDLKAEIQQLAQGLEELSHQVTTAEKIDLIRRIAIRLEEINPRIQHQMLLEKDALCAQLMEMVRAKESEIAEKELQLNQTSVSSAGTAQQGATVSEESVKKKLAFAAEWARKQVDKANSAAKEQLEKAKQEWEAAKKDEVLALRNELELSKTTVVNGLTERLMMEKSEAVEDERRKLSSIRAKNVELNLLVKKLQNEREAAERQLKSFKKQQAMLGLAPDVGPMSSMKGVNGGASTAGSSSVSGGRQRRDSFSSHGTSTTASSRRRSVAKMAKKFLGGGS